MEAYYYWLNSLVNKHKSEYTRWDGLKWLSPYDALDYQTRRDHLLRSIQQPLFEGTKPFHQHISTGCSICGAGQWSCLFITNKCNASCFYCPAPQSRDEIPSTQGMDFPDPLEYASYIHYFGFKGVSFSGGEPLLFFDRTLDYLKAVRQHCNNDIYTWMYTNGILADEHKMNLLGKSGLNEIRFDIGATAYRMDKIMFARNHIPVITIEIPAIPEEKDRLISMLPRMKQAGVTNLNLHQLRLTSHNAANIYKRGYTIACAEKPLVVDSELTALEIIMYAKSHHVDIGINYCSFHFKNRFQKAGYRTMIAKKLFPRATINVNGYIRKLTDDKIVYESVTLYNQFPVPLNALSITIRDKVYYYRLYTVLEHHFKSSEEKTCINRFLQERPSAAPSDPVLFKIWQLESMEQGLRAY